MDRDVAVGVLLQLFSLRWRALGRVRWTSHVLLCEVVDYLEIDPADAIDLLAALMAVNWIASIACEEDAV